MQVDDSHTVGQLLITITSRIGKTTHFLLISMRNHSVFQGQFQHYNFGVKIPQNNDFKMVPDKIKDVTFTCTSVLRTLYVAVIVANRKHASTY